MLLFFGFMSDLLSHGLFSTTFGVSALITLVWLISKVTRIGSRDPLLPPGPPTFPVLGNLHQFPKSFAHLKLTEWARTYGGIYSLKLGPGTAIVVTSPRIVKELMDKRSGSTVDRPPNFMADAITGGLNMVLARYTHQWRLLRRAAHEILTRNACAMHLPIQQAESIQLMYDLVTRPEGFYNHIRRFSTSVISSVLFGTRCPRYETPTVADFFHVQHLWEHALEPGAHPPVDLLPILRFVPERWAPWKTLCKEVRRLQRKLYFGLLEQSEKRILDGKRNGCFMEEVLDKSDKFGMDRELTGYLGGVLLEGGSDTTSSFIQSLILALVAFPDVQAKAHEEIDRVIGSERLPTIDDFKDLPYIQAIVKENHRFRPVAPLAVPHASLEVETVDGYVIPEGTTIFVNNWGMFHDEQAFEKPEVFNPDRFLTSEYGTKSNVDESGRRHDMAFGSGRRICPGIHLAQNSISLNTMNLIWGFNFREIVDPVTKLTVKVDIHDYAKGILTCPNPFRCGIQPRSTDHVQLIKSEFLQARPTFLAFEHDLLPEDVACTSASRVL